MQLGCSNLTEQSIQNGCTALQLRPEIFSETKAFPATCAHHADHSLPLFHGVGRIGFPPASDLSILPLSPSGQMRSLQVVMPMRIEVSQSSASEFEARLTRSFVSSITAFLICTVSAASASASFEGFEKSLK